MKNKEYRYGAMEQRRLLTLETYDQQEENDNWQPVTVYLTKQA